MEDYYSNLACRIADWLGRPKRTSGFQEADGHTFLGTSVGNVRPDNQDRILFAKYLDSHAAKSFYLWGLCDGIGGLKGGGACAEAALAELLVGLITSTESLEIRNRALRSTRAANRRVYDTHREKGGSTLAFILMDYAGKAVGLSVGDSRIYRLEGSKIQQLSRDETIANQLRLMGNPSISPTGGVFANQLSQYIGIGDELVLNSIEISGATDETSLILTSDGAHCLHEDTFRSILTLAPSGSEKVKRLLQVAKWTGGKDNASAVCFLGKTLAPISRGPQPNVLEIWDGFEKLDCLIEPHFGRPESPRPQRIEQRPPTSVEPPHASYPAERVSKGRKKQRRGYVKPEKPAAQIEIIRESGERSTP
jgi:PPM family protein phosphatase